MTHVHTITYGAHRAYAVVGLALSMMALPLFMNAGTAHADSKGDGSRIEVSIGESGRVLVRGAKVTSVASSTITANTSWGASVLGWTVKTDGNTDFVAHKGSNGGLADIAIGDTVSFSGKLDQTLNGLQVHANVVKDWTSAHAATKLSGIITGINSTLGSFTITHDGSTTTVQTSSSTDFDGRGVSSFADLVLNAKVKIRGFFSATSSVFTAQEVDVKEGARKHKEWKHGSDIHSWIKAHLSLWQHND